MSIIRNGKPIFKTDASYFPLWDDVQANTVKGHGRAFSTHLFLQFQADQETVRTWLRERIGNLITSTMNQLEQGARFRKSRTNGDTIFNFYLSGAGYLYLGLGDQLPIESRTYLDATDDTTNYPGDASTAFADGMGASGGRLDDPDPDTWDEGFRQEIHALISIADDDLNALKIRTDQLYSELAESGLAAIVQMEEGKEWFNANQEIIEHFGFVDGISQPEFFQEDMPETTAQWDPFAPLDLILAKDPNGNADYGYGSFLVFRKLEQDVEDWDRQVVEGANEVGVNAQLFGAMSMGRFKDGTPVTLHSSSQNLTDPENDFTHLDQGDDLGSKCPFHAHTRKTNPRFDTEKFLDVQPGLELSRRIARRGITYGNREQDQETLNFLDAPSGNVGLLFVCHQANIAHQFETQQANWSNDPDFVTKDVGVDGVTGQTDNAPGQQHWPTQWDAPDRIGYNLAHTVHLKGGEYFFAPSLSFFGGL